VDALTKARDHLDLVFFSWLSAIDGANDVEVGDTLNEETEERIELLCTVCDLTEGRRITFSTDLPNVKPSVASIVEVYVGANWHEREAAEMFGIEFEGHPDPGPLYLPESFLGNPLKKSYPLLSREVKPWPGTVDVEDMPEKPSTENPEA
ncbi:MAG: NADH-quinone oxidoreductase subunit C, partial [Acidimicrobiia bacterium]